MYGVAGHIVLNEKLYTSPGLGVMCLDISRKRGAFPIEYALDFPMNSWKPCLIKASGVILGSPDWL